MAIELPIKPHEQRALNFLINEYLLARSYKLTSITFSDENEDQDFEDWQDVGLNIPKPAEVLQIYREYMKANGYDKPPSTNVAVQTDFLAEEVEEQKSELQEMVRYILNDTIYILLSFPLFFIFICRRNRLEGCRSKSRCWNKRNLRFRILSRHKRRTLSNIQ